MQKEGAERMSTVSDNKVSRLTDPNLAFLASKAAIELGRVSKGRATSVDAVTQLGQLLKHSAYENSGVGEPAALTDPTTISLLHRAIKAEGSNVVTLPELISEALQIAEQLESTTESSGVPNVISRLRAFCLGLADTRLLTNDLKSSRIWKNRNGVSKCWCATLRFKESEGFLLRFKI